MSDSDTRATRIRRIVDDVRQQPKERREAFLDEACGDDDQLRVEIDVVLARLEDQATRGVVDDDINDLLTRTARGDAEAADRFWALVFDDLSVIARSLLRQERRRPDGPETVSLVLRAYDRLMQSPEFPARNKEYFFGAAKLAMRRILIELARKRAVPADQSRILQVVRSRTGLDSDTIDIAGLEEALERLTEKYPRAAEVVRLRLYNGLSVADVAGVLGVADRTVESDWALARAWLHRELTKGDSRFGKGDEGVPVDL